LSTTVVSQGNYNIYPNPSSGILNIEMPQSFSNALITITDATGRTVYEQSINNNSSNLATLQIQHLQSGLYILSINTGASKVTSKLMIQ
jgi:hypothetical protein